MSDQILAEKFPTKNHDGKLKLLAEDFREYAKSGLYRHFDASGRLLYIGETENFLSRSVDHLRTAAWAHKIHTMELEPMSKTEAKELEPKAIAAELPLYNMTHHPKNEQRGKAAHAREQEKASREREEARKKFESQLEELERQEYERRLELQRISQQKEVLIEKSRAKRLRTEKVRALNVRNAPWDGRLETYRSIYD